MTEKMLGAFEDGAFLGFITFVENVCNEYISKDSLPNIYLCTLIVKPEARGKHLTYNLYDHLFNKLYGGASIFTRTWSTNGAHTTILGKMGFELIHRIENDRGEGIDTVYFGLKR